MDLFCCLREPRHRFISFAACANEVNCMSLLPGILSIQLNENVSRSIFYMSLQGPSVIPHDSGLFDDLEMEPVTNGVAYLQ